MNNTEPVEIDDYRLELENRIRNLLWTVSGDYGLDMKPDVSLFLRSKAIALYDGIKQGALARYYDKDMLGLYLVKKIFMEAGENELTFVAQLCIEEAIGEKVCKDRESALCRDSVLKIFWIRNSKRCHHRRILPADLK